MPRPDPLDLVMLSKEIDRLTELLEAAHRDRKSRKEKKRIGCRLHAMKKEYEEAIQGFSNNGERLRSQVQGGWAIADPGSRRFRR